mmetsp:Transcript_63375/g.182416  ORF Transcript_63375/g.182416 Transcript_63375/m.182416 type:complete len:258 (+) Transcript_63375:43-816(+)
MSPPAVSAGSAPRERSRATGGMRAPGGGVARLTLCLALAGVALGKVPSRKELQAKDAAELKAILRSKGAKCTSCIDKEDVIDRVIETWDWSLTEAVSPDGKTRITKEMFVKNVEASYKRFLADQQAKKREEEGGHQLAGEDDDEEDGMPVPDVDKAWLDFSERLRKGEIKADEKGALAYEMIGTAAEPSWWSKYKTHVMLSVNVLILWVMQHVRKRERQIRRQGGAAENPAQDNPGAVARPPERQSKKHGKGKVKGS